MVQRRDFLKSAGAVGAIGLSAGCIGNFGSQPYGDGTVTFVMSPSEPQEYMMKQYKPVKQFLAEKTASNVDVKLQYAADYTAVLQALGSGNAEIAETGPFAAALGVKAEKANIALQRYAYGSWDYSSVIVTRKDSGIETLSDLKGKKIAFADMTSASGSLYPLYQLKQAGLDVGKAPRSDEGADFSATWSSHAQAFQAMKNGQADACGVGRFITVKDADENGDGERDYKDFVQEVSRYKGIPRAPVVTSPTLSTEKKEKLVSILDGAPNSMYYGADGKEGTNDDLWFSKMRPADLKTYQPVIDVANDLGISTDLLSSA
ncbi:phosphate/phosphite/phosphonate ABC transporter substrate-binding protein [Halospeciosus flavus]|uniref:Phosphate/phosphite/phosphonate ABC transporter substrate-binding protein n=1 Tax=Halospeciosus flavus TaxID=3032283 RepID=A0ABD5Z7Z3_9EURY|nr:phosphate/phosphite/phosphonate ABC transporter substrate-binding protein [Halospeciosus flavus]